MGHRYERLRCVDGFTMSVQAGEGRYSEPNEDCSIGYSQMEVGFPSEEDSDLMPYAENPLNPTQTIYGWVPVTVLKKVIRKHGGISGGGMPRINPLES